jgi:hypothetical protein
MLLRIGDQGARSRRPWQPRGRSAPDGDNGAAMRRGFIADATPRDVRFLSKADRARLSEYRAGFLVGDSDDL